MWRRLLIPLAVAGLAWLSYQWLWHEEASIPPERLVSGEETPDAYMEQAVMRAMDEQGRPRYELMVARAEHFAAGDRSELQRPFITFYRPQQRRWTLRAAHGQTQGGDDHVYLDQGVVIHRLAASGRAPLEIHSRDLRIDTAREYAETGGPVELRHPRGQVEAIGLRAWFETGRLELLARVRGVYAATP